MAIKTFGVGEVLTAADTNTYLANSGLVYVASQTFANVGSVDVKQCFSSTYDYYKITTQFTLASSYLYMQLIQGTTPTVRNSNSYVAAGFQVAYNGALATANDALISSYSISPVSITANAQFTLEFRYNNSGQSMWSSLGHCVSNGVTVHKSGGYHTTETHDGFRLLSGANMSGTINVYGYRKA